jgi:ribosome maturation factor RimP
MNQSSLQELFEPVVTAMGYELVGVEYISQGKNSILRMYIDKPEGIAVEDCEAVSRQVSAMLDVEDPISGQYALEVSSPGLERPLFFKKHYEQFAGERAFLRLHSSLLGRKKFKGTLICVTGDDVVIEVDGEEYVVPIDLIDKANLIPDVKF